MSSRKAMASSPSLADTLRFFKPASASSRSTRKRSSGLSSAISTIGRERAAGMDDVATLHEGADAFIGDAALDFDEAAVDHHFACRFARHVVLPAGGVTGLLHVHAEVDLIDEDLDMSLRLHCAAHYAEAHPR